VTSTRIWEFDVAVSTHDESMAHQVAMAKEGGVVVSLPVTADYRL
jgi:hypothetical protein